MPAFVVTPSALAARPRPAWVTTPRRPRFCRPRSSFRRAVCVRASADAPNTAAQAPVQHIDHVATDQLVQSLQDMPIPPPSSVIRRMVEHLADSRGLSRLALVDNFGRIGSPAVPFLLDALNHSPNPVIRRSCGKALAKIGDPQATPVLLQVLVNDPDTVTRSSAAGALAKMGPSAVPALLALIADPDVPMTPKGHAAWAIAFMRGGDASAKALFDAAESPNDDVRLAVVGALGTVAIGDSLPVMAASDSEVDDEWDTDDNDVDSQTKLRALSTLRFMLSDPNAEVRAEAATALANAGCSEDAPAIAALLKDKDAELRRCAALSLMKLGDSSFVAALRERADDESESENVRVVARLAVKTLEMAGRCDDDDDFDE